jgi:hypothetical protein
MDETYGIKKVGGDKIALLGIFALSLLAAYFITASKSALVLSEPIELSHTGLALSVPSGNGWLSENQWKYHENAFTLSSVFAPDPARPAAVVRCQYLFTADKTTPQMRFEQASQRRAGVNGTIVKTGQTQKGMLIVDWAQIEKTPATGEPLNLFFGTTDLPNNRRLNIEVHQIGCSTDIVEKAFRHIVENLNFKDNRLLEAGSEIVAKIKSKGLTSFLDNQNQQVFFLIKTVGQHTEPAIGFTMDVLIDTGQPSSEGEPNIQAAGLFYTRSPYNQEQITSFRSDNSFDKFVWKSETYGAAGRRGAEIILDKNDVLTVRKFDVQPEEKSYQLIPAAVPNIFLQQILSQMINSDTKEIVVDIIKSEGTITPTYICRIEPQGAAADEGVVYTLEVGLLCEGGFSEQVYLDRQKQISKKVLQLETVSMFERAAPTDILKEFPERADIILQKSNPPKADSL